MANLAEGATGVLHCLLVPCEVLAVVAFKHYGWMIMNRVRDAQIARLEDLANRADLDPEFAKKFLNFIIAEVIQHHKTHQDKS